MRIDILTLFPRMFEGPLGESIIGKAVDKELLNIHISNFREFSDNKHQIVDDYPYGGGAGMLLKVQPIYDNLQAIKQETPHIKKRIILLDPAGTPFDQTMAEEFAKEEQLIFICGHYEGYDERIRSLVTDEVSLGDYVLTGGELGAMVMIDATVRLLPSVLGNDLSAQTDSYSTGLLEHPQYTRPANFNDMSVPEVLTNGNHRLIANWQKKESLRRTYLRRPDLLTNFKLTEEDRQLLDEIIAEEDKE
ncbi:tRNA (guanosine(37)-N1)-methyltransferase TrmD [Melissococcus plutonius]|uniref:tRNA (guanine-N(1)-)-methyltransferase n=1 Tax=Melissococcus plutonius TaxID=33970 RepID=A0A2Z5Y2J4_9ENTE|nr:tRNA (guanosine(37)-N1)-methyltransferase TrmD [Melissococcus plutonius]BAL62147.1 tRNA (Guanine37-N1) -methyltransferase [Melissococcus plutonius DAT561]MCV2497913.1 tRNA (guanosine(37)-N1)-methyltransferase TrmD [Melissococcus plutonius]MCV2500480.1 tRNA (guanosine(37)-N1)-methyltransferase TrmD [Melissococcus plutonius]MCV2505253.1 tRNA (guanosine(37)-N1)-methyltransferase TrmD [Melissococcus plutonius]MCV2506528.1 tRNA (guanosine(37)-N1)-methyltransferase TrmD [Melissococcus plutonius]